MFSGLIWDKLIIIHMLLWQVNPPNRGLSQKSSGESLEESKKN